MRFAAALFLTFMLFNCTKKKPSIQIEWDASTHLPAPDSNSAHLGLAGPITGISNGVLFIGGGANFIDKMPWDGGSKTYHDVVYLFSKVADKWEHRNSTVFPEALAYSGNASDGVAAYIVGGENQSGPSNSVYSIHWTGEEMEITSLPPLPVPLTNGSAVVMENTLYFIGGENTQIVSDRVYGLSLQPGADWVEVVQLPYPVACAPAVVANNKIQIVGGRMRNTGSTSTIYNQLLEVDIMNRSVQVAATLPYPVAAGTAAAIDDSYLLLIGGDKAETFHKVEDLIGKIQHSSDENVIAQLTVKKATIQREHPGFTNACYAYSFDNKSWEALHNIVGKSPVTTTALVVNNQIIVPSGEVRAGVRTDQILIGNIYEK